MGDLITIYQHRASSGPDRFYCDTQIPNNYGWGDGVMIFRAYSTQQPGTIPIYRHSASNPDRYFLDTQIPNNYGWSPGVVLCYAYPATNTLVDDIMGILGHQGAKYKGVTYYSTSDNRFTLLDTPRLWDQSATVTLPIQGCEDLLTAIAKTIASALNIVDITLLWQTFTGLPGGRFQQAIAQGLWALSLKNNIKPLVRILIGVPLGPIVAFWDMQNWLQSTLELGNHQQLSTVPYDIQIACSKAAPLSWNHSKIVAADGVRAVVGGHNLWAKDYLSTQPIHDVSGLVEGSVVQCIHNFCDQLWAETSTVPGVLQLSKGQITHPPSLIPPSSLIPRRQPWAVSPNAGTTRILSLGRLGNGIANEFTVATNASVSARIMAMCRAKNTIRLAQQSLYFSVAGKGGYDCYTLWSIVKAIEAGVNVQIVVSNDVPLSDGGYAGDLPTVLSALASLYVGDRLGILAHSPANPARTDLDGWANASLSSPVSGIPLQVTRMPTQAECAKYLDELNARLSVAPLYYAPNINYWQVGSDHKPAGNHAKVYIIDDTHFYVGSDNAYLSGTSQGLQEYGHLIEGQSETRLFIQNYWDKLWKNSGQHAVKATTAMVQLLPDIGP